MAYKKTLLKDKNLSVSGSIVTARTQEDLKTGQFSKNVETRICGKVMIKKVAIVSKSHISKGFVSWVSSSESTRESQKSLSGE